MPVFIFKRYILKMTSSENYNFKWNSFSDHVLSLMRDMLLSPNYADVTLVSDDGKLIMAHRTILQACSSVFNDILKVSTQSNHPVIYLRGINKSELEPLMELIYTGSATFERDRLKEFLLVAKNLQIKELCSIDEENDIGGITSETAENDTSIGEDNSDTLQSETLTNDERVEINNSMTDTTKEMDKQHIQNSDIASSDVNSEIVKIENEREPLSENSNEEDKNEN